MIDIAEKLILLVTGWLLGVIGPHLTGAIERRRLAVALSVPLEKELRDVRERCAATAYYIGKKAKALSRTELRWTIDHLREADREWTTDLQRVLNEIVETNTDAEIETLRLAVSDDSPTSVRRLELPFLQAHLHQVDVFPPAVQAHLLELMKQVRFHNEFVDETRQWLALSYDSSLTETNHALVVDNFKRNEGLIRRRCKDIADDAAVTTRSLRAWRVRRWRWRAIFGL